jgi:hypothetical protein
MPLEESFSGSALVDIMSIIGGSKKGQRSKPCVLRGFCPISGELLFYAFPIFTERCSQCAFDGH